MKKCLITFILGFSLIFSGMLISCNDPVNAKENTSINDSDSTTEDSSEKTKKEDSETSEETKNEEQKQDEPKKDETPEASTFTVSFSTDGGTKVDSQTVDKGSKAKKPATDPTKNGCTFDGWYTSTDGGKTLSSTAFDFNTAISANITIYAKWNIAEGYYKVTFELDGGTLTTGKFVSVQSGEKVTKPADPTKSGYEFDNWYSDSEYTTAFDFANTSIAADTSIYAKWIALGTGSISFTQKEIREVTMTKSNGSYTFTVSQLPEDLALPEGTTLSYRFIITGQSLTMGASVSNQNATNVVNSNTNTWTYNGNLEANKDYKIQVQVNHTTRTTSASGSTRTDTIGVDCITLYFKG